MTSRCITEKIAIYTKTNEYVSHQICDIMILIWLLVEIEVDF